MLKGIPAILSPELLKTLCEMGHGDTIAICDANCPAMRMGLKTLRCDVQKASELVDAILKLMPLDTYETSVYMMEKVKGDENIPTDNWDEYYEVIKEYTDDEPCHVERFAFYDEMRKAYAAVITADTRPYGNIILRKGTF